MAEPFTIYKITILYMLNKADFPLSNMQIVRFFLEKDYTDYFRVQEALADLEDTGLISAESTYSDTQYSLTDEGKQTLNFFRHKITEGIEADVLGFLSENQVAMRRENSVLADYRRTPDYTYAVRLQAKSGGITMIDLTLTVRNEAQAEAICSNWKTQNDDVYAYLMDILLK